MVKRYRFILLPEPTPYPLCSNGTQSPSDGRRYTEAPSLPP